MKEATFYIDNMTCSACSSGIEKALNRKDYCQEIAVHLLSKRAHIIYDESKISIEDIFAFIAKMGYEPYFEARDSKKKLGFIESIEAKFLSTPLRLGIAVIATIAVLVLSWGDMFELVAINHSLSFYAQLFLSLIVAHLGRAFYFKGFKALFAKNPNMDSLIAISTTSAFIYSLQGAFIHGAHGYFDSVCVIITLVLIGKAIESSSKKDALDSATMLLSINQKHTQRLLPSHISAPYSAKALANAPTESIKVADINTGDVIKILAGEMIAIDCEVIAGSGSIDSAAISGESLPNVAKVGDRLFSGSINIDGMLYVKALSNASNSSLAKMLSLLQNARDSKAPIANLADKIAGIFVPLVIFLATCALVFWWGYRDFAFGLSIFIATLVISCPCALGLATPMAILHAQSVSNKMGVFFKEAKHFQALSEINHIIFDKTGTLTNGLEITDIKLLDSKRNLQDIFNIALSLESSSQHLIAKAFSAHKLSQSATLLPLENVRHIQGGGISADIDGITYIIGNASLLPTSLKAKADEGDKITIFLATSAPKNAQILAQFALQDFIKPDAKETIARFRAQGIESSMISGDSKANTKRIARLLNISDVKAKAMPEDKMQLLKAKNAHKVLMVGDGINDALALASAHASIAFSSPFDIATQSADIIVYNHKTLSIYNAYNLAKSTIRNIKQNLGFAFCYNVAFIPLAMGVLGGFDIFLHPMFCAFAMTCSSLSVVGNAARLRRFRVV